MARKRLNKNMVIAVTLAVFAVMIVLSVLMLRRLQQRDPKYFIELAQSAAGEGHWQQAAVFYEQAWRRSNEAKHLVEVGEMLLRDGDVQKARMAWHQALVQEPNFIEGHLRQLGLMIQLARLYGSAEDWEAVRDAADALLKADAEKTSSETAQGHNARGMAFIQLRDRGGDPDEGLNELRKACELDPESPEYAIDLGDELIRRGQMDEAAEVYTDLTKRFAGVGASASKIRVAQARFLVGRGQRGEAEGVFRDAIAIAGKDAVAFREAKLAYAAFLTQQWAMTIRDAEEKEEAAELFNRIETILKECVESDPEEFDAYLQLAVLYRLAARHGDVVDVCEKRISRGLSRKGVESAKSKVSTFTLMIYASEACVALGINAAQTDQVADRDRWLARAEQYVADARGEAPTHPRVLSQAGRVKIARGQERAGLEDLRAADEGYRLYGTVSWENRLIRARVHLQLNEAGAARSVLEEVIDNAVKARNSDPTFWNLYAQTLVQVGDLNRALSVVERMLAMMPDNEDATRIKAAIFERQGKTAEAGALEQKISGSGAIRAILDARAASLDGDSERAVSILRKALEAEPSDLRVVAALAEELAARNRDDEAGELIRQALVANPDNDALRRLEISLRRDLTPEQRDEALLRLMESEPDAYRRALALMAHYARKNDAVATLRAAEEAEKHLKAQDTPMAQRVTAVQHTALLRTKLRAAAQINDEAAMAAARDEAAKSNVDGSGGKSILGLYHLLRREYELAAQAFQAALQEQPTQVSSMIFLGQCLQSLGRTDDAREEFERASRINPNEAFAHQGLALLAQLKGDKVAFQRELAVCEKLMPDDPWVREQQLIREEEADPAGAIARREAQLLLRPDETGNLQRLAALYQSTGDRDKADAAYGRLLELLPDDARTALAAADHYRRTARSDRALEVVQRFANSRPTKELQAGAAILVANEYFQRKDMRSVERTLLEAADLAATLEVSQTIADFYLRQLNQADKALPWVDRAVEMASATNSPQLAAILERRVGCLLDRGVNDIERARKDVAELRRRFPDNIRGPLLESEIHARAGEIEAAVTSLSEYLEKRPDDSYARYQLARHEIARGRPAAAIENLERVKRSDPKAFGGEPRVLLANLRQREGRKDLWIAELEALARDAPDSPRAVQGLVDAYIREKRFADADRLVTGQINRTGEPDARWFALRGRISIELNDNDKALTDFKKSAEVSGLASSAIATVLEAYLRLGRFAEGAAYYEQLGSREETDARVLSLYGRLLVPSNRTEFAVDVFRRAMALAVAVDTDAIVSVTGSLHSAFGSDDVIRVFEQTPSPQALIRANERILARLCALAGRFDCAIERIDRLIDKAPSDRERASLLHERGDVQQLAGAMDLALEAYEESLKYDAANWVTLNNVAYLLSDKRGENKLALPYAQKAVAKADNPFTLDTLGWIYVGLGEFALATAELNRAIRLNPDYALSYYHLGECLRRDGKFDEARDVLENGRRAAESVGDSDLIVLIDASLEKARRRVLER